MSLTPCSARPLNAESRLSAKPLASCASRTTRRARCHRCGAHHRVPEHPDHATWTWTTGWSGTLSRRAARLRSTMSPDWWTLAEDPPGEAQVGRGQRWRAAGARNRSRRRPPRRQVTAVGGPCNQHSRQPPRRIDRRRLLASFRSFPSPEASRHRVESRSCRGTRAAPLGRHRDARRARVRRRASSPFSKHVSHARMQCRKRWLGERGRQSRLSCVQLCQFDLPRLRSVASGQSSQDLLPTPLDRTDVTPGIGHQPQVFAAKPCHLGGEAFAERLEGTGIENPSRKAWRGRSRGHTDKPVRPIVGKPVERFSTCAQRCAVRQWPTAEHRTRSANEAPCLNGNPCNATHRHVIEATRPVPGPLPNGTAGLLLATAASPSDAVLEAQVAVDSQPGAFRYSYVVTNPPASTSEVSMIRVNVSSAIVDITSPPGWRSLLGPSGSLVWYAADLIAPGADDGSVPRAASQVVPGASLGGFSFRSTLPPRTVEYTIQQSPRGAHPRRGRGRGIPGARRW